LHPHAVAPLFFDRKETVIGALLARGAQQPAAYHATGSTA